MGVMAEVGFEITTLYNYAHVSQPTWSPTEYYDSLMLRH
jgi:hypothetical protein